MSQMLAAQLVAPARMEVREAPVPDLDGDEVLVQMHSASICGSDIHRVFDGFYGGEYPAPPGHPGHEGVGVVVESRSPEWAAGDPVLTVPTPRRSACFAQYQAVSARSLVKLPADMDLDRLLMAQQLGTVIYAFRRHWPPGTSGGRTATVIGAGSAGLFFLQWAKLAGFEQVVVADLAPDRLELAQELGAARTVLAPDESVVEATMELTAGVGADLVVEAAGYDTSRAQAIESVRQAGRVGFFGYPERPGLVPFPFETAWRRCCSIEIVSGTQEEPGLRSFQEAVEAIRDGRVAVDHLLGARYPLARFPEAFEAAHERRAVKVLIDLAG